jgi:hypothetical protein
MKQVASRAFNGLHGGISQEIEHFITTGVRTSNIRVLALFIGRI